MWREFFESYELPCFFGEPASTEDILHLEQSLSAALSADLRDLLLETNGVAVRPAFFKEIGAEDDVLQIVWSLEEVQQRNTEFHKRDNGSNPVFAGLSQLLFFAGTPNGDPIGCAIIEGRVVNPELIVISHEDYKDRRVQRSSLKEYLTTILEICQ